MPAAITLCDWLLGPHVPFDYFRHLEVNNGERELRIDVWRNLEYDTVTLTKQISEIDTSLKLTSFIFSPKWPLYEQRHDKVILHHENAR